MTASSSPEQRRMTAMDKLAKRPELYETWRAMIRRCHDEKHHNYALYGARGITVCEAWRVSIKNFQRDMGRRPPGTTLGRIDNNGNYEPSNCRWETPSQQASNKRTNRIINAFGEEKTLGQWEGDDRCSVSHQLIANRIRLGWPTEIAISAPSGGYRHRRVDRVCGTCGRSFTVTQSIINRGRGKYCSRVCSRVARGLE